jgi:hypothetical protein
MKNILRSGAMLAVLMLMSAGIAKADELSYTLTGPNGFDATWDMAQNPTPSSTTGISFDAPVNNFIVDGSGAGSDVVFYSVIPSLTLAQGLSGPGLADFLVGEFGSDLFSGPLSSPTMNTGDFSLFGTGEGVFLGQFTLHVAPIATPEPSALLLLVSGLMGLGITARRKFVS